MSDRARQVFEEVLRSPPEQRADLAAELLRSLDEDDEDDEDDEPPPPIQEIERRWAEEIMPHWSRYVA